MDSTEEMRSNFHIPNPEDMEHATGSPMETEMIGYYAKRANEHDRIYDLPERQEDIRKLHALFGSFFQNLDVLEISCGTGYWTKSIATCAKSVTASDINMEVLDVARNREWTGSPVEFLQADSYSLPDFGRKFSAGFSGFWWSHIPKNKLNGFLSGFHQHLAPGALVVFVDNRYVEGSSTPVSRVDENGDSFQLRKLGDGSTYEVLKNFPLPDELEAAVGSFAHSVEVVLMDYYWILSCRKNERAWKNSDDIFYHSGFFRNGAYSSSSFPTV